MNLSAFVLGVATSISFSQSVWAANWPSKSLSEQHPTTLSEYVASNEGALSSAKLFDWVWRIANSSSDVDNRAYLFSLAVDLYNNLPPDLSPECELERAEDCFAYPPSMQPYKQQIRWRMFEGLRKKNLSGEWVWALEQERKSYREILYIRHYLTSNVTLPAYDDPVAMQTENLNLKKPSLYPELTSWMGSMATAMTLGIEPAKAEEWTLAHCNDWGGCDGLEFELEETDEAPEAGDTIAYDDTTEAVGHIGNVVKSPEPEPTSPEQDEKPVNPLRVWGALGAVVLFGLSIGLFAIFRGRRKPD